MHSKLGFFDFDDTLFNTQQLKSLTAEFLKTHFSADISDFKAEYDAVKLSNNGIYSIVKHIQKYTPEITIEELKNLFQAHFSKFNLLFDYTEEVINHLQSLEDTKIVILTYGEEETQLLKMGLYGIFSSLDVIVVQVAKREIFKQKLTHLPDGKISFEGLGIFDNVYYFDDNVDEGVVTHKNFTVVKIEPGKLSLELVQSTIKD